MCQLHDRGDQQPLLRVARHVLDEDAVDFQIVGIRAVEHVKPGQTGAEVVDGDAEARRAQPGHRLCHAVHRQHLVRLAELDADVGGAEPVIHRLPFQPRRDLCPAAEKRAVQVQEQPRPAGRAAAPQAATNAAERRHGTVGDQRLEVEQRVRRHGAGEQVRRPEAPHPVGAPDQRLDRAQPAVEAGDGLECHVDGSRRGGDEGRPVLDDRHGVSPGSPEITRWHRG